MASPNSEEKFPGYTKIGVVGKGAFGTAVLFTRNSDGKKVVIKEINIMDMPPEARISALNEVKVLSALNHQNIIKYYGSFEQDGCLMIEMEYANGGTLAQLIQKRAKEQRKMREIDVLYLFHQMVSAIGYMHKHNVLHRDLKSANIFLTKNGQVKVGDFGISKMMTTLAQAQTIVGTPYYLSPEMCEGKDYDAKSDIWALGCILYEMIELKKPFEATSLPALVTKITATDFEPISRRYSDSLNRLVNSILQHDSTLRPTAQYIYDNSIPEILNELQQKRNIQTSNLQDRNVIKERSVLYEFKHFKNEIDLEPIHLPVCKFIDVAVGNNHCLAVAEDYSVYAWGVNEHGQLGINENIAWKKFPVRIEALAGRNIIQVAAGNGFSIFLNSSGNMFSVGYGKSGCLGHGDWRSITYPRLIGIGNYNLLMIRQYLREKKNNNSFYLDRFSSVTINEISCGDNHVMAISSTGDLYSWGSGRDGRLGLGDEDFRCTPTHVQMPRNQKIRKIFCGPDCSIAITTEGYLFACGLNTNNKLGLSTFFRYCEKSLTFIPVKLNRKIKEVAMGRNHTTVLTEDGYLLTIGKNRDGQLGRGHLRDDTYFREVKGFQKGAIKIIACGAVYTAVGANNNVIHFWGTRYDHLTKRMSSTGRASITGATETVIENKPLTTDQNPSTSGESGMFSPDLIRNNIEVIKSPEAILGLYASSKHVSQGKLVWLVKILSFGNSLLLWINTTAPLPVPREETGNKLFPNRTGTDIFGSDESSPAKSPEEA